MAYDHEREEWLDAVAAQGELKRMTNCGHLVRVHGVCMDCGDDEPQKDSYA